MEPGVVAGVIVIGLVHGVLPDHGWPIAAMYALRRKRRWLHGAVAGLILGVGHLVSSVALVLAYYWVSGFAAFAEGPWLRYVAGTMLIALGIYEYHHGDHGGLHDHDDHHTDGGHSHDHHDDHSYHGHAHEDDDSGLLARLRGVLPGGGHRHLEEEHAERGLFALGTTALLLGFAHEEPIQILAICVGTEFCLELMLVYSVAVIVAILVPTLLLVAGYEHHRETVERYTPYLPTITAVVLVGMGLAFISGLV